VRHLASGRIDWRVKDIKKRPASFAGNSSQDELKAFSPFWITKQIILVGSLKVISGTRRQG